MAKRFFPLIVYLVICLSLPAQKVDYSVVSVAEEAGLRLTKITCDDDVVCMPMVKRSAHNCTWWSNRMIGLSPDGLSLAFLSAYDDMTNIFVKDLSGQGGCIQRTRRRNVLDFSYSPDGRYIAFSEKVGKNNQIFQTDARNGYVCRQITAGSSDYSPAYSSDMNLIYFTRQNKEGVNIWSNNLKDNYLSTYTPGMSPCPCNDGKSFVCVRTEEYGNMSIWRIDIETGAEDCVVSDPMMSFSTPTVSPDGRWLLFVGSSAIPMNMDKLFYNTDIYVCRLDGTNLMQLTHHAADDLSPVWGVDGKSIYFVSQRGSIDGMANVWKMDFKY